MNATIQGSAADLIKIAMNKAAAKLKEENLKSRLILQVHDELIVECPENIAPQVAELVSREMEGIAALKVPLTAEAKIGKSWFDAK